MTSWLSNARDSLRAQLWPIPTIAVIAALLLGLGLPELDSASQLPAWARDLVFGGDADAARSLLGAIASSLITVTSLTFSLTVVTLQLASSQFSPRLLRTFTSDLFVQVTLALFLATFTFALTVLRAVRSAGDSGQTEFVPRIAISVAFVLTVASVIGLVLFLAHLVAQIRVETMLQHVHRETSRTMRSVLSARDDAKPVPSTLLHPRDDSHPVTATDDGFLTWIVHSELLSAVVDEDALLRLDVHPGAFVVKGTPLGVVWPASGGPFEQERATRLSDRVAGCVRTGAERTAYQDVGYGLRQLVDVANKALSPGVNDPTTAVHALDRISAVLCELSHCDLGPLVLWDEDGRARAVLHRPGFHDHVDVGLSQPRRYGAADPQVMAKIFQVLIDLARQSSPSQRPVVRTHLARLRGTCLAQSYDSHERATLAELGHQVEHILGD